MEVSWAIRCSACGIIMLAGRNNALWSASHKRQSTLASIAMRNAECLWGDSGEDILVNQSAVVDRCYPAVTAPERGMQPGLSVFIGLRRDTLDWSDGRIHYGLVQLVNYLPLNTKKVRQTG